MLLEWLKVVILGVVEGVTEFLPVSSTGHLIVVSDLLNYDEASRATFDIFIQFGAVVAVVLFYRADLWAQLRDVRHNPDTQRLWLGLFIAFLPAALLGFLLRDWIKNVLFQPSVVALALIIGGVVMIAVERFLIRPQPAPTEPVAAAQPPATTVPVSLRQAVIVGLVQTLALIPGVSRSAASIIGGMLAGMTRTDATRFSFFLAIPVLGLATLFDFVTSIDAFTSEQILQLIVGAVISGVVAWFAIGWLLRYVSRNNFIPFGVYRILIGILILLFF